MAAEVIPPPPDAAIATEAIPPPPDAITVGRDLKMGTDRLEFKGAFPGDAPWADAVRRWQESPQRAAMPPFLRALGSVVEAMIPMTGAETGATVALAPFAAARTLGPLGRLATSAVKVGSAGLGAGVGEAMAHGNNPGSQVVMHAIPTALTEGGLRFAEKVVVPRLQDMRRFGTWNPRTAGKMASAEEAAGRKGAETAARDATAALEEQEAVRVAQLNKQATAAAAQQTAALRQQEARRVAGINRQARYDAAEQTADLRRAASDEAAARTAQARADAQATRDAAEAMRTGTLRSQIARGMSGVVPELESGPGELYGAAFQWGKPQLDRVFDSAMAEVNSRLGQGARFRLPQLERFIPGIAERTDRRLTFDEARTALAELGSGIGQAGRTVRGARQAYTAVDYHEARQALRQQLNDQDILRILPDHLRPAERAGDLWADAMSMRAAGRTYLGILQKSIDPKTGNLDPDKLRELVNRNVEKYRERFGRAWEAAEQALLGGERVPAQVGRPLKTPEVEAFEPARVRPVRPSITYPNPVAPVSPTLEQPNPVTPVLPVYPPPRAPFAFGPGAVATANLAAQDPRVGAAEMYGASYLPSLAWRWAKRLFQ